MRDRLYTEIHAFLKQLKFLQVKTPILSTNVGGASARPFKSHFNDLDIEASMRIAPELFLKMLVVGGLERVYEIGEQFRNEGIDATHSPEFTSIELYVAHWNVTNMREFTENFIRTLVKNITGKTKITCTRMSPNADGIFEEVEVDFENCFRVIEFVKGIEEEATKRLGREIKIPSDFSSDECNVYLEKLCDDLGVVTQVKTTEKMFDALAGELIEVLCDNPTFIINHPMIMSPLAKEHQDNPQRRAGGGDGDQQR